MEVINIFGKTYQVSKQAKYSYYSSIIIISIVLLKAYQSKSKSKSLLPSLIIIITACLSPYATNCMSSGKKCEEYGWYLSISNMMIAALLLLGFIKNKSKMLRTR